MLWLTCSHAGGLRKSDTRFKVPFGKFNGYAGIKAAGAACAQHTAAVMLGGH
jgi:hypothetical protein